MQLGDQPFVGWLLFRRFSCRFVGMYYSHELLQSSFAARIFDYATIEFFYDISIISFNERLLAGKRRIQRKC